MAEVYIVEAVRTPVGKRVGELSGVHPADLGATSLDPVACGRSEPKQLPSAEGRSASFARADVRDPDQAKTVRRHGGWTYW